jgi:hypothetical protein
MEEDFGGLDTKIFKRVLVFNTTEDMQEEVDKRSGAEVTLP